MTGSCGPCRRGTNERHGSAEAQKAAQRPTVTNGDDSHDLDVNDYGVATCAIPVRFAARQWNFSLKACPLGTALFGDEPHHGRDAEALPTPVPRPAASGSHRRVRRLNWLPDRAADEACRMPALALHSSTGLPYSTSKPRGEELLAGNLAGFRVLLDAHESVAA